MRFIDSRFIINDDNYFGLKLFLDAKNIYYTSKICVYYRVNYGSISHPKSYNLNGDINLYYTYFLNAYNIKELINDYKQYKKILIFNASHNANAFIAISNKLNIYNQKKITMIKNLIDYKYKIFILSPIAFKVLKTIGSLLKRIN